MVCLLGGLLAAGSALAVEERPNILFIAIDDLRPELSFYGEEHIKSPNLDKLAEEGAVFTRAYCNIPVCGASRASLMTGARPTRKRFIHAKIHKDEDHPDAVSLAMHLKGNGYTTISNGKIYHHAQDDAAAWDEIWHSGRPNQALPENRPDDESPRGMPYEMVDLPDDAYKDGDIANKGIADLKKLKADGKPFFLAVGFRKPHLPFTAPKKYWDLYDRETIQLPESYVRPKTTPRKAFHSYGELRNYKTVPKKGHLDEAMAKKLIHGYYACVSYVDAQVGRLLQTLEDEGLAENTIVVVWGDHGWNLGEHMLWCKHCTFETSTHAPLLFKVPGKTHGQKIDSITEFIDIYPTICDLTGVDIPNTVDGETLVPLMEGRTRSKDYAVSKFKDAICLIQGTLFYTEWVNDQGETYERMLFDHAKDPMELNNLAVNPEYADTVKKLSKELRKKWGSDFLDAEVKE